MRVEEPTRWACSIPRPSITPSDFSTLVKERASAAAPSDTGGNNHELPKPSAGIQLKHTVPEYLDAFKTLHVAPRPCKHWLGSKWQRQLADVLIEQKKKKSDDGKVQQGTGAPAVASTSAAAEAPQRAEAKASGPSTVGMSQAFMDQLKTRRRDELKKAQEKAAGERREQERVARMNTKVLEVKRAKLEALNGERAADCTRARQELNSKVEAAQALSTKLERVQKDLQAVEVDKHRAVTLLKAKRAEQSSSTQFPRNAQSSLDADATIPAGLPASNGSTVPKPPAAGGTAPQTGGAADCAVRQEGQPSASEMPAPQSNGQEGVVVLPWGITVNAPTFPPASGFVVPRLFGSHEDIDLQTPQGDSSADVAANAGAQKRKRVDDKSDTTQNKVPVTASGLLPPPQPLSSTPVAGKSTLPPAPNTNLGPGNQAQKVKRPAPLPMRCAGGRFSDEPRPRFQASDSTGGRFSDEPRPRFQGSDSAGGRFTDEPRPRFQCSAVIGGVRGSSGSDRRPEIGSFIGRPVGAHDQAPGFLPRAQPEEGDDLFSSRQGFPSNKSGGMMVEGLKPLPPVGTGNVPARGNFPDKQPQLLPPPPMHSMTKSDDVPPPPAWNFSSRVKKEDGKGGD